MQTTTITCDRCKKSATTKEEKDALSVLEVAVGVYDTHRYGGESSFTIRDKTHHAEWCKECHEALGLFFHRPENPQHAELPTLEQIIRDIVSDEVRNTQAP